MTLPEVRTELNAFFASLFSGIVGVVRLNYAPRVDRSLTIDVTIKCARTKRAKYIEMVRDMRAVRETWQSLHPSGRLFLIDPKIDLLGDTSFKVTIGLLGEELTAK